MTEVLHKTTDASQVDPANAIKRSIPAAIQPWIGARSAYPRNATVADLFEEMVRLYPQNIAAVFGEDRLTYFELDQKANRLANRLRRAGVGEESMVCVCLDRSLELIVALLAVLKTGGAYVPVDRSYPIERFDFILADTKASVVISESEGMDFRRTRNGVVASLSVDCEVEAATAWDDVAPTRSSSPGSLAYVIYTSGSTGLPKGVMVENRAIVRLVSNTNYCEFGPGRVFLQAAAVPFDASTFETWGALLHGGTVAIAPPNASLEDLGRIIRENRVDSMWLTSSLFNLFVDERLEDLATVQQVLAGGESLSARHVRRALEKLPRTTIINGYGPTENTTFTCCHTMRPGDAVPDSVPIGRPIANTFVYILDDKLDPVGQGETGELYAGGDGVARGYLNAEALTAEKFLKDPFADAPDARMYRTGDMARWGEDGIVEFVGRIDNQVKILGHRIELGEIETALGQHPDVMQASVLVHQDAVATKHLVAYFVVRPGVEISKESLKSFLGTKLPCYMVPGIYVELGAFPLTANGKLDRRALPVPDQHLGASTGEGARSELEKTISTVWQKVLGSPRVGIDDNFFDLGGSSLSLLGVHSQLQKALVTSIRVVDLFEFPTIRQLAAHIANSGKDGLLLSSAQLQGQKQREAFARRRAMKGSMQ
jgi:amino acid adenylation domain-containing protein